MLDTIKQLGRRGEQIARRFLVDKNYKISTTNYHSREGEVDIIAEKLNKIYFVEVKTRRSSRFGTGEEAVDENKLEKLSMAAQKYLQEKNLEHKKWQIDLITIKFNSEDNFQINHIENISF